MVVVLRVWGCGEVGGSGGGGGREAAVVLWWEVRLLFWRERGRDWEMGWGRRGG